jgi:hypothetical protein
MGDSVEPALIGLAGVLIGSVISVGANFVTAVRKERADVRLAKRNTAIEMRKAARLVSADLSLAIALAQQVARNSKWWNPEVEPTNKAWGKFREVIAPLLDYDDWHSLRVATEAVDILRVLKVVSEQRVQFPADVAKFIDPVVNHLEVGLEVLRRFED